MGRKKRNLMCHPLPEFPLRTWQVYMPDEEPFFVQARTISRRENGIVVFYGREGQIVAIVKEYWAVKEVFPKFQST